MFIIYRERISEEGTVEVQGREVVNNGNKFLMRLFLPGKGLQSLG